MKPNASPAAVRNGILVLGLLAMAGGIWAVRPAALPDRYDELSLRVAGMH